jgi:hypothetical protein
MRAAEETPARILSEIAEGAHSARPVAGRLAEQPEAASA